jgi:hypothetical protein
VVAVQFGLRHICYEGGPDNSERSTANLANRIRANRTPEMAELIQQDLVKNVFPYGPVAFTYYCLSAAYSRYGAFGLTEDYRNLQTPKFKMAAALASHAAARK